MSFVDFSRAIIRGSIITVRTTCNQSVTHGKAFPRFSVECGGNTPRRAYSRFRWERYIIDRASELCAWRAAKQRASSVVRVVRRPRLGLIGYVKINPKTIKSRLHKIEINEAFLRSRYVDRRRSFESLSFSFECHDSTDDRWFYERLQTVHAIANVTCKEIL